MRSVSSMLATSLIICTSRRRWQLPDDQRIMRPVAEVKGRIALKEGKCDNGGKGTKPMSRPQRPVVALLATPETSALVLYGLYDVLLSAGAVYPDMVAGVPG